MAPAESAGDDVGTVAAFAREHGLELVRFAYLMCGDRGIAEDLVQDLLAKLYQRFPHRFALEYPLGYARRALVNANVDRARRASSREVPIAEMAERPRSGAVDGSAVVEDRDLLWQALRRLPHRQRAVVVLRYYGDLPDVDIAATLRCRRGTVRSLASRALATMRAMALSDTADTLGVGDE